MVRIVVDNQEIEAAEGQTLLQACLDSGIYIPHLCYLKEMDDPPASCRMCFVELEGRTEPIPSCTVAVQAGMIVRTDTPEVRGLQRSALKLLLSKHDLECRRCPANKRCELQRIARLLKVGLKPKPLEPSLKIEIDETQHPLLNYDHDRCVLCGRCVFICGKLHPKPMLIFARRGFQTFISHYGVDDLARQICQECLACVDLCPVRAISVRDESGAPGDKEQEPE